MEPTDGIVPDPSPRLWAAPTATAPVAATVTVPGSKSQTNRALVLAAIADAPSTIVGALRSRDTDLMVAALRGMGADIRVDSPGLGAPRTTVSVFPAALHGGSVDCGLAGTVMRFVPPVAALAEGTVFFDGDPQARSRPMDAILNALRDLGLSIQGDRLPFTVTSDGNPAGGRVEVDATASSQFISGLLLAAARFRDGVTVVQTSDRMPSRPHIEMTVAMLREAGVQVDDTAPNTWTVAPGPVAGRTWRIEPDLSNATPFLAAAAVTGGTVAITDWPQSTTQAGDQIRPLLERMGCQVDLVATDGTFNLQVTGPRRGELEGIDINMSDIGELTPTVVAMAAVATTPTAITGIAHLRGHETDRLAALATEIGRLGGNCRETADGLAITPTPLHGGHWHSYADHRMATAGAILGLVVPEVQVEDIHTTSKTMPDFDIRWAEMLGLRAADLDGDGRIDGFEADR